MQIVIYLSKLIIGTWWSQWEVVAACHFYSWWRCWSDACEWHSRGYGHTHCHFIFRVLWWSILFNFIDIYCGQAVILGHKGWPKSYVGYYIGSWVFFYPLCYTDSYSSFLLFSDQVSQQPHTGPVSVPTTSPSLVNSASVLGSGVGTTQTPSTGGVVPVQGPNSMHQQGLATAPVSQPLSAAVKTPPKVLPLAGQKKPAEPMPQASQPARSVLVGIQNFLSFYN